MIKPTAREIFDHLSEYYDLPKMELAAIVKTPMHPHGLRDEFAGRALATTPGYASQDLATWDYDDFAKHAYSIADAMLEARKK